MKVLFYNDPSDGFGGAETYWHETAGFLEKVGVQVQKLSFEVPQTILFQDDSIKHQFQFAIKEFEPDIIHLNKNLVFAKNVHEALRTTRIPVIATVHDYYTIPFPVSIKTRLKYYFRPYRICASQHIVPSRSYFNKLKTKHIHGIHYVPHFVNLEKWTFRERCPETKNELLFVGRLEKIKGVSTLVAAVEILAKRRVSFHLTIIGSGSEEVEIHRKLNAANLAHCVSMAGFQPPCEVLKYFHQSAIAVVPSLKNELFGLVGLEAQASGIPVIASDLEGIREWCKHEISGLTVKPGDPAALAKCLEWLLENPAWQRRLSKQGRLFAEQNFPFEPSIHALVNLYRLIIRA